MNRIRDYILALLSGIGAGFWLKRVRVRDREITILTFHRISDEKDDLWMTAVSLS